jgi:hypothetical protein
MVLGDEHELADDHGSPEVVRTLEIEPATGLMHADG